MIGLISNLAGEAASEVHCNVSQVVEIGAEIEQYTCNVLDGYLPERLNHWYQIEDEGSHSNGLWVGILPSGKGQCQAERAARTCPRGFSYQVDVYSITRRNIIRHYSSAAF